MPFPELVRLEPLLPYTVFDRRYETTNNVTGKILYHNNENPSRLAPEPAKNLVRAVKIFNAKGIGFKIFDDFRTPYAHAELLKVCGDGTYVDKNSGHLKGLCVDGTILHPDGTEFDMGTGFDDFDEKSHLAAIGLEPFQEMNRILLAGVMASVGFKQHKLEWWHFTYVGKQLNGALTD